MNNKTNHRGTEGIERRSQRRPLFFVSVIFSLCPLCLCGSFSSEPQRRTTPLPVEQARAGLRVDPGLRVELAGSAAREMIASWVMA